MRKFFLGIILLATPLYAGYKPVEDLVWFSCHNSEYIAEYRGDALAINYKFCTVGSDYSAKQIDTQVIEVTNLVFDFSESLGIDGYQCTKNDNLEIYDINEKTLNTPGRFPIWINESPQGIWGLYDPRISDENVSSLMITDHGSEWNDLTFAHELSHYWYDRLCFNKQYKGVEKFAQSFEKFYLKNRSK